MPGLADLQAEQAREALRLLGEQAPPTAKAAAIRRLRARLSAPGFVEELLDQAPEGARNAFLRVVADGAASVDELLGRGWWGYGVLPPPLDWLQRRGLLVADSAGLIHPSDEASAAFREGVLPFPSVAAPAAPLRVEDAGCVVVAEESAGLGPALGVPAAALRAVAPTVALSSKSAARVTAALRAAGVALSSDVTVTALDDEPALPGTAEQAIGPAAIRRLLSRALAEERQVWLEYYPSSRGGAATERTVDPWRFRDDLLTGWCHLRTGERTFALDRVGRARLLSARREHAPEAE